MLTRLAQGALAACCVLGASAGSAWHFVDVSLLLCESQSEVQIEIPLDAIPAEQRGDPHILTFFRTSTEAVSLQYNLTDSSTPENRTLDAANVTLRSLNASSARRLLDADGDSGEDLADSAMDSGETVDSSGDEDAGGRRLGGFRRRSSTFSSPRRRSSPSPAAGTGTFGQQRRRAPASAASGGAAQHRRRQAPAPPAPASGWGNHQGLQAGSYGYPSAAALSHSYGGRPPASTGYGYSGAGAYRGGSGAQIAMAAGAGVLAGVGASYAWSRLHHLMGSLGEECWAGDQQYKNCAECRLKHSPASDCAGRVTPRVDLARDDLMTSGFVPSNVTGPLRLIITEVLGVDFTPELLCPPSNWTDNVSGNASGNISGNFSAIFVTLTRLASAPAVEEEDPAGVAHSRSVVHFILVALLAACCCAGCVAGGMFMQRSSGDDPSKQGSQVQFPAHDPSAQFPAAQWPAAHYPQPYPAAAHFQQQYPVAFQPGHLQFAAAQYRPGQPAVAY